MYRQCVLITIFCAYPQTQVTRLGSPYGECSDPSSKNSTRNAYEELYPVDYSETVSVLPISSWNVMLTRRLATFWSWLWKERWSSLKC